MKESMKNSAVLCERFNGYVIVSAIRSQDPRGFGGCIFSGCEVSAEGKKLNTWKLLVVKAKAQLVPVEVIKGELWRVSGVVTKKERKNFNGFWITESTIEPEEPIFKERVTGDLIITLVANNPKFKKIARFRISKLYTKYGDDLYNLLDNGAVDTLANDLGEEDASAIVEAWKDHVSGLVISCFLAHKFPLWLALKVLEYHGNNTAKVLEEDSYRLLSYTASWPLVDSLAKKRFRIVDDDPRRLRAAIEESLYQIVDRRAHTIVTVEMVVRQLKRLLCIQNDRNETKQLIGKALSLAEVQTNGAYIITEDSHFWPTGIYVMEEFIARQIASMVVAPETFPPPLCMANMTGEEVDRLISEFEAKEYNRLGKHFELNKMQKKAVKTCVFNRFAVIVGGAGSGKTTVLRCFYYVIHQAGYMISQMAQFESAAKRMNKATGIEADTIAGYLRNANNLPEKLSDFTYYVIDEASTLDLPTTYQIFRSLPEDKHLRMVMVGDPYLLPPVMAGLIFHVLAESLEVPVIELTEVTRQDEYSDIHYVANAIRHGTLPQLPAIGKGGVKFIPCKETEILNNLLNLFAENPDNTQIVCAVKNNYLAGTKVISEACHERFSKGERELMVKSDAFADAFGMAGLRENDRVMFTKNDLKRGVYEGSIGTLTGVCDEKELAPDSDELVIAKGNFEGSIVNIYESDVFGKQQKLVLGYGIKVDKTQGRQWPRVIMPVHKARNFDRTLVYTAITRAEEEVILVGDLKVLEDAVRQEPKAHGRLIGFRRLLYQKIHEPPFL